MTTLLRCAFSIATVAVLCLPAGNVSAQQSPGVAGLLAEARQALGGDASRAEIRSFRIKGTLKSLNRLESGAFEIVCVLPDKFLQIEQRAIIYPGELVSDPMYSPSVEHRATKLGFNDGGLIFHPHINSPVARQQFSPTQAQLNRASDLARVAFANLTLGLFAESFAAVPLHFTAASGADASSGVQVVGPSVRGVLTFNSQTRLPERFGRVSYEDYRDVGGRKVPCRMTEGPDQWLIREFLLNADINEKMFKPTNKLSTSLSAPSDSASLSARR